MLYLPKSTDGPISKYINRRISGLITWAIVKYGVPLTPNQVSIISFFLSVLAAILYLIKLPVIAAILVQVSSIIDGVDGELARVKKLSSPRGAFLDSILDRFADILVIASISILTYEIYHSSYVVVASLMAITGDLMVSYLHARGEASLGKHPILIGRIKSFASRDVRLFIIFVGTALGYYLETLLTISIVSYTYVISKFIDIIVSLGESREG